MHAVIGQWQYMYANMVVTPHRTDTLAYYGSYSIKSENKLNNKNKPNSGAYYINSSLHFTKINMSTVAAIQHS